VRLRLLGLLPLLLSRTILAAAVQGGAITVPLPLFPANNWWNTDVSSAPLDASSTSFITFLGGPGRGLHPDFGGDNGDGEVRSNCFTGHGGVP